MPFKSKAQLAKFASLVKEGKMSQGTFDKWKSETENVSKLPVKLGKSSKSLLRRPRRTAK
jgi:hypothetical protein